MMQRYGEYYDVIKKLGNLPLVDEPTIDQLMEQNRSLMNKAYREIRDLEEKVTLVEYMCLISTYHLVNILKRDLGTEASLMQWVFFIIKNYKKYQEDVRNFLKFWHFSTFFYPIFIAAISGEEYTEEHLQKEKNTTTGELRERRRCSALMADFSELLVAEDILGTERPDHDEHLQEIDELYPLKTA